MSPMVGLISPSAVVFFTFAISIVSAEVKSPPYFVEQPLGKEILFYVPTDDTDRSFEIPCEAKGIPAPDYRWTKNGEIFDWTSHSDRISVEPGKGTLLIKIPKPSDVGQYQCYAENIWGTAASNSIWARKVELHSFRDEAPAVREATEGQPYNLTCQAPYGYPKPSVNWIIQDPAGRMNSINKSRITVDPMGTLWFSSVTQSDASDDSLYACAVTSPRMNDVKIGYKTMLQVTTSDELSEDESQENEPTSVAPIEQYTSNSEEIVVSNTKVRLFCIYGGTPLPTITWKKDDKLMVFKSSRISLKDNGKSIEIKKVTPFDEGTYTCEATNGIGDSLSHTTVLKVLVEPSFVRKPESFTVDEEETVLFHCEASGNPTPEIIWTHNGKPISEAPSNLRRTISDGVIVIEKLWKNDTGNYGCNATNSVGYVYHDAYVNVLAEPPSITESPEDREILEGGTVTIKCRADGSPKPRITWLKDDVELSGDRFTSTKTGDLTITNVHLNDMGDYVCLAQNKISSTNAKMVLTVRQRTRIPASLGPSDSKVRAGDPATFRCSALTDPSLERTITWLRDGQSIDFSSDRRFVRANDDSLSISNSLVSDSAMYTCVVSTRLDNATAEATLLVQDVPNPPKITSLTCTDKVAEISWLNTGDNGAPVILYRVLSNSASGIGGYFSLSSTPTNETTFKMEMVPGSNYTFQITAANEIGSSSESESSSKCVVPPDAPYKNPSNVNVRAIEPTSLVITWDKMRKIDYNGPGFYYNVSWKTSTPETTWSERKWQSEIISNGDVEEYTVRNLLPHTNYTLTVIAGNSVNQSTAIPEQSIWCATPPDVPYKNPDHVTAKATGPTTIEVSWEPMPETEHNGPGFYYNVSFKRDVSEDEWNSLILQNWQEGQITILDAIPFEKYLVKVNAGNDLGLAKPGPESLSIEVNVTTLPDVPYKNPSNVTAQANGSTSIRVSWNPMPKPDQNGPEFYYNVSWKSNTSEMQWESQIILDWETKEYEIQNTLPFKKYEITVNAGNSQGQARPVAQLVECITPADVPYKNPDNVTVQSTIPTTVSVSWEPMPENEHNGPGFHYNVSWKIDSPEAAWQTEIIENWKTNEYKIQNAVPYQKYLVTVTAANDLGTPQTILEAPVEYTTPADIPYKNPSNVTMHSSGPTTLQVSWEPMPEMDHNGPNFYYNVLWKKDDLDAGWRSHIIPEWNTRQFFIPNPLPFEKYLVKVTSGNDKGPAVSQNSNSSDSKSPLAYSMPANIPFKNPDGVTVEAPDPETLVIKWKPMPKSEHNGPGFYYNVWWKVDWPEVDWENHTISEWQTGEYTVSVLPYEKHFVKVIAGNELGESTQPPITAEACYEEEVPLEAPKHLKLEKIISSTSAKVSWNRVPKNALRGHFQKYEIETWPEHNNQIGKVNNISIENNVDYIVINNLTPNTKNKIRISVFNGRHQSPFSEELEIPTPEGVPEPVQSLQAKPLGSSALDLAWKPPLNTNGNLTGYRIYYQKILGTEVGPLEERRPQITNPNQTRAKLLDLEPDTNYRILIEATTNAGEGKRLFIHQKTPPPSLPLIQPDFQIIPIESENSTTSEVKIIWHPCGAENENTNECDEQSIGSQFRVSYGLKGDSEFEIITERDENSTIVSNLQPNQEYEFVVTSIDGRQEQDSVTKPFKIDSPTTSEQVSEESQPMVTEPTEESTKVLISLTTSEQVSEESQPMVTEPTEESTKVLISLTTSEQVSEESQPLVTEPTEEPNEVLLSTTTQEIVSEKQIASQEPLSTVTVPTESKRVLTSTATQEMPFESTTELVTETPNDDGLIGWVALVLAIVILIIIVLLISIYLKHLAKGGKYYVREIEKNNGRPDWPEDSDLQEVLPSSNVEASNESPSPPLERDNDEMVMIPLNN